jgi:metal-responsive CopG/Arc/MetJ family transcriptional regulator
VEQLHNIVWIPPFQFYRKRDQQANFGTELTDLQHRNYAAIMSSVCVHLDHDNRLAAILVRGDPR